MVKVSRYIYLVLACLFVIGVVYQVYLAGLVVVASRAGWGDHIGLGHTLAGPLLLMLITQYLARLPRSSKTLTWILFVAYALQADVVIFMRGSAPLVSALHPVLALVDFAIGYALVVRTWRLIKAPEMTEIPAGPSAAPAATVD
ncbi:MAG TPA: DUF6220 domain-containing protein [Bellilinea sp.]